MLFDLQSLRSRPKFKATLSLSYLESEQIQFCVQNVLVCVSLFIDFEVRTSKLKPKWWLITNLSERPVAKAVITVP